MGIPDLKTLFLSKYPSHGGPPVIFQMDRTPRRKKVSTLDQVALGRKRVVAAYAPQQRCRLDPTRRQIHAEVPRKKTSTSGPVLHRDPANNPRSSSNFTTWYAETLKRLKT